MESPITQQCLALLRTVQQMKADILTDALQVERLRRHQAAQGTYYMVEQEPVHVSWSEGRLRLRATCDTRTGEVLAVSVQPMPVPHESVDLPALDLSLIPAEEPDPAQGVLGFAGTCER